MVSDIHTTGFDWPGISQMILLCFSSSYGNKIHYCDRNTSEGLGGVKWSHGLCYTL